LALFTEVPGRIGDGLKIDPHVLLARLQKWVLLTLTSLLPGLLANRRLFDRKVEDPSRFLQFGVVFADFASYLLRKVDHAVMEDRPQSPIRVEAREVAYPSETRVAETGQLLDIACRFLG
jgi:hypothetical protein